VSLRKHRPKISPSILETVGNTPLVRLSKLGKGLPAELIVKLEYFNPMSSVKCRIGSAMISAAEKEGALTKGMEIIEPTSGNTGIGLAYVAAAKGYPITLTMPDTMSVERRQLLKSFGAKLILTPGEKGMPGAILRAKEISDSDVKYYMPQQFNNPENPKVHEETTALEILDDTDGQVDIVIAGVGTGGTITGTAKALKKHVPKLKAIAVEPEDSPVLSGGKPGPHKLQGIGAGFIPKVLDLKLIDEVLQVTTHASGEAAKRLAVEEGILVGISSGSILSAALQVAAREENKEKRIVAILPDSGERYLSTWLFDSE